MADIPPPFICVVASVTDAETIRCADGPRVRLAGINAREKDGACRPGAPCPPMGHQSAQPIVERLTLHKRLTCRPVGRSFNRVVADCVFTSDSLNGGKTGQSLSCAIVRTGAAVWWPAYVRKYGLEVCK